MAERRLIKVVASVMKYDDVEKRWYHSGESQTTGISNISILVNDANGNHRIVAQKADDTLEVTVNMNIQRSLKYHMATPTFHQWRDQKTVYGLNFQSEDQAHTFAGLLLQILENIKQQPPASSSNEQSQTQTPPINGTNTPNGFSNGHAAVRSSQQSSNNNQTNGHLSSTPPTQQNGYATDAHYQQQLQKEQQQQQQMLQQQQEQLRLEHQRMQQEQRLREQEQQRLQQEQRLEQQQRQEQMRLQKQQSASSMQQQAPPAPPAGGPPPPPPPPPLPGMPGAPSAGGPPEPMSSLPMSLTDQLKNTNLKANLRTAGPRSDTPKTNGNTNGNSGGGGGGGQPNFLDELRKKVGPRNREENVVTKNNNTSTPVTKPPSVPSWKSSGTKTPTGFPISGSPSTSQHNLAVASKAPTNSSESISIDQLDKLKADLRRELQEDFRRIVREELRQALMEFKMN